MRKVSRINAGHVEAKISHSCDRGTIKNGNGKLKNETFIPFQIKGN